MPQNDFGSVLARLGIAEEKGKTPTRSDILKQLEHIADMGFYARPTRFSFNIESLPSSVNDRLLRNCMNISLPGRSIMSQGFKTYGPVVEHVYEANYGTEITMTLRVGEDLMERDLFEGWMNLALSYETSDVSYPDDYMTSMRIYQMNRDDGYVYGVRLNNVFCKTLSDMEMSSDASDQVSTINITLGYTDYAVIGRIGRIPLPPPDAPARISNRKPIYPGSKPEIDKQLLEQYGNIADPVNLRGRNDNPLSALSNRMKSKY